MSTFVLVHGGRHGGWCWNRVAPILRSHGHEVYCPTLTGLGEKSHLLERMQIDLETHIEDITNLLMYEGLEDVILIGHSYAGMVITGVADRMPVRVAHLVYLDAVVPKSGESALDLTGAELASAMREWIDKSEGNRRVPSIRSGPGFYGVTDPDDIKWMAARLTDQPSATYEQPLRLKGKGFSGLCTYIRCSQSEGLSPKVFARVHSDAIFKTIEIQASHDVMITDPQLLARTLLGL